MSGKVGMKKGVHSKLCSKCKINERLSTNRYCRECRNAYEKENRKLYSELSEKEKFKSNVRRKTNMRVQRGLLVRKPCEVCNEIKVQAHHDDYRKPYDVRWLCRPHHLEFHKLNGYNS